MASSPPSSAVAASRTDQRASLLSLPSEIIIKIASHFDRRTAKAFALVASRFTIFAEPALWRSLELSLQPHFGERPWNAAPVRDDSVGGTGLWPDQDAENWRHRAVGEMARGVLLSGNARRWGMVEKIRMEIYHEALYRMTAILDLAAPTLLSLKIQDNARRFEIFPNDTLDYHLHHRGLPFPSLTHLVFGPGTLFFPATLVEVVNNAPNLISLDVNLDNRHQFENDFEMDRTYAGNLFHTTQLQRIRYICNTAVDADPTKGIRFLTQLLERSQGVTRLVLDFSNEDSPLFGKLWTAVRSLPELRDLHWALPSQVIVDDNFGASSGFLNLRRLIMDNGYWVDLFSNVIPDIPNLRVIYLPAWGHNAELHLGPGMSFEANYPYQPQEKFCDFDQVHFFDSIRRCPKLHSVHILGGVLNSNPRGEADIFTHLDNLEREDRVLGRINSLRHGTEELVHLRYLLPWEISPTVDSGVTWNLPGHNHKGMGPRLFPRYSGWRDVLDLNGFEVPAKILQEMKQVEGVADGEWRGRGIAVGKEAWKVLTDWRKEIIGAGEPVGQ